MKIEDRDNTFGHEISIEADLVTLRITDYGERSGVVIQILSNDNQDIKLESISVDRREMNFQIVDAYS